MARDNARLRRQIYQAVGLTWPIYSMLPQLRGIWLFSSVNAGGDLIDTSGHDKTLTNTGTVTFAADNYLPYASLNGSSQYFTRGDEAHFDITGAMTLISMAYFDNTASANEIIAGKITAGPSQRAYRLYRNSSGKLVGAISPDGTGGAAESAVSSTVIASGDWALGALRFTPSTEVAVFLGYLGGDGGALEKVVNTSSISASIFNSNADFSIGVQDVTTTPALHLAGRVAITILCAAALSDDILNMLYAQIRPLAKL